MLCDAHLTYALTTTACVGCLEARVAELEARNGYLERRQVEMQKGQDACKALADLRASRIGNLEDAMTPEQLADFNRLNP